MAAPHIVLVGDSIFDNATYTRGEPDVVSHLRALIPKEWRATLCAVDGATTDDIDAQVRRVPRDATHVVMSIGGNDALRHVDLLSRRATAGSALEAFAPAVDQFTRDYAAALDCILALHKQTVVCTIYNGRLESEMATAARMALGLFNDVIQRSANHRQVPIIELRCVCVEPEDYANPIEPSGHGGLKIAKAIRAATRERA